VGELAGELSEAAGTLVAPYLVRTVLLEAAGGLPLGEPLPTGPEVPKEEIQPLLGIKDRILRCFGIFANTSVLFGGKALNRGDRLPLPH
jgi:hypothetical protein